MKNLKLKVLKQTAGRLLTAIPSLYALPSALKISEQCQGDDWPRDEFAGANVCVTLGGVVCATLTTVILGDMMIPESHESYTLIPLFGGIFSNILSGGYESLKWLRIKEKSNVLYE